MTNGQGAIFGARPPPGGQRRARGSTPRIEAGRDVVPPPGLTDPPPANRLPARARVEIPAAGGPGRFGRAAAEPLDLGSSSG